MLLSATQIEKHYGNLEVLKGVDIEVSAGEIVSLVGSSGAGKSTLLHILGTLDNADSGKVLFENNDILAYSSRQQVKYRNENIGFIFQFHHLMPEFTAIENVCMPGFLAKRKRKETEKKATELLKFMNMSHRLKHRPNQLSGGEQQRVSVARALINKPKLVLADEPTGNLDSKNSDELYSLFRQLTQEFGTSFLIATHDKQLAQSADRKLEIIDGII